MGAPDAEIYESRYKIEQLPEGFIVRGNDRVPIQVNLVDGTHFKVMKADERGWSSYLGTGGDVGLIEGKQLIRKVASSLMGEWQGKNNVKKSNNPPRKLKDWAIANTAKGLAKRIKEERLRLVEKCDQRVYSIQKAVFAAAGKLPIEANHSSFYKSNIPYYLDDVVKYRAAALTTFMEVKGYGFEDWKQCYTNRSRGVYTSLNKTLMNLPGGIPLNLINHLKGVILPRPITSRRELVFILGCACHHDWDMYELDGSQHIMVNEKIRHIIMNATADEITRSAIILGKHLRTPINLRKAYEVTKLSQYIMDAQAHLTHNGNLVGLTEKAIDWHRQRRWSNYSGAPPETLTALPPISLPASKDIIFLKNVGEVIEEGQLQSHCIATYAKNAVSGQCYLFHVNHAGTSASAQVDANTGIVVQAYGNCNSTNKASVWAKKQLGKWGDELRKVVKLNNPQYNEYSEIDNLMPF